MQLDPACWDLWVCRDLFSCFLGWVCELFSLRWWLCHDKQPFAGSLSSLSVCLGKIMSERVEVFLGVTKGLVPQQHWEHCSVGVIGVSGNGHYCLNILWFTSVYHHAKHFFFFFLVEGWCSDLRFCLGFRAFSSPSPVFSHASAPWCPLTYSSLGSLIRIQWEVSFFHLSPWWVRTSREHLADSRDCGSYWDSECRTLTLCIC